MSIFYQQAKQAQKQGQLSQARALYQQHVKQQPHHLEALYELGVVQVDLGQYPEAVACFEAVITRNPNFVGAYHEMGVVYLGQRRYAEAIPCFERVVALEPQFEGGHRNLALALKELGHVERAKQAYQILLKKEPHNLPLHLHVETLAPLIAMSNAEIDAYRAHLTAKLTQYTQKPFFLDLTTLHLTNATPPYVLPYQGRFDRAVKEQWAQIFQPKFAHYPPPSSRQTGKPQLGIVVTRNHEGIFLKSMAGIIDRLPPSAFKLTIVCNHSGLATLRQGLAHPALQWLIIPDRLDQAIQVIQQARFDMLFYWEVTTDVLNYFLPFCRLARVQCVSWGTAYTSGNPAVDYQLSSKWIETADSQAHYSEKLIQFEALPTYYFHPIRPEPCHGRDYFNLSDTDNLYVCVQNLMKVHPDFDPLIADILRRDKRGGVLFLHKGTTQAEFLQKRFQQTMPDVASRIRFLPRLSAKEYLNLLAIADVSLDTLYYCGGNTSYEAFAMGTPVVTLPGQFQRGRYTYGLYQIMGITECIARTPAEYVEIALRLGTDSGYRQAVSQKILAACPVLFEDDLIVREMTAFFQQVLN